MELAAIIGLGNPGPEYAETRHNVGFRVADELARRWRVGSWGRHNRCLVGRRSGGRGVWLVKPQSFMNMSGEPVAAFCAAEGVEPRQCLIVVDDVELPVGRLRLRQRGGSGTHNGLRSVVAAVGEEFPRLRLGVQGSEPWSDLADYVLAPFGPTELEAAGAMIARAADCVEMAIRVGVERAASRFNRSDPDGGDGPDTDD
jgi:PTH1 family peptidyl-tRNA hydrolase